MKLSPILASSLWISGVYSDSFFEGSSFLQIKVPYELSKPGGYEHREALFGDPAYGRSITQPLYYADSNLCDRSNINTRGGYPSRRPKDIDDGDDDDGNNGMEPWPSPFILMVDRGGCTFVQKARNAQHVGAAGVIIADNICLCSDTECMTETKKQQQNDNNNNNNNNNDDRSTKICENDEPIMMDDGTGSDIHIPTMIMRKHDSELLKHNMVTNDINIQIQMGWSLPKLSDETVEFELWTSPSEYSSKEFQTNWRRIASRFGTRVAFIARQYVYDGTATGCHQAATGNNMCGNLCTNGGKYCALDPDGDMEYGASGADVVTESLRRICIWKEYSASSVVYLDYIHTFLDKCDNNEDFTNRDCINKSLKAAKIDTQRIENCMSDSGGTIGYTVNNNLLDAELKAQVDSKVFILPSVFINKRGLRGTLNINNVLTAICAAYVEGTAPSICTECSTCADTFKCILNDGLCSDYDDAVFYRGDLVYGWGGGISKRTFGFVLLSMCSLFGVGLYVNWKRQTKQMKDDVRIVLSEYMPLDEGETRDANQA